MHEFEYIEFRGCGCYRLTIDLVDELQTSRLGESISNHFEARNNVVTIDGAFDEWIIKGE